MFWSAHLRKKLNVQNTFGFLSAFLELLFLTFDKAGAERYQQALGLAHETSLV